MATDFKNTLVFHYILCEGIPKISEQPPLTWSSRPYFQCLRDTQLCFGLCQSTIVYKLGEYIPEDAWNAGEKYRSYIEFYVENDGVRKLKIVTSAPKLRTYLI